MTRPISIGVSSVQSGNCRCRVNEPTVTLGDVLTVTVAGLAGVGSAMAWFSNSKKELNTRMAEMEGKMEGFTDMHAEHNTQLAVVKACQVNTALILSELKEGQKEIYVKLDDVLKEIRRS